LQETKEEFRKSLFAIFCLHKKSGLVKLKIPERLEKRFLRNVTSSAENNKKVTEKLKNKVVQ
jgi:hypothetical protein